MTEPDPLLADLADLDPTATDPPPTRASVRDRQILERAMSMTVQPDATPIPLAPRPTHGRRRIAALAGAATAAAAVLTVLTVTQPDGGLEPVAALTVAADTTGQVTSLRVDGTYEDSEGSRTLEGEVDGSDSSIRITRADGSAEWRVIVGDQMWEDEEDGPVTVTPDMVNAPFPGASEAVLEAALQGATVEAIGTEDVAGVAATHYAVDLGAEGIAALGALSPTLTAQFELEYPQGVTDLDVWVADDLIRKVVVSSKSSDPQGGTETVTLEFSDFGADITIQPPS